MIKVASWCAITATEFRINVHFAEPLLYFLVESIDAIQIPPRVIRLRELYNMELPLRPT
jgi:hypothetical protein